jgi:hypothetical protein
MLSLQLDIVAGQPKVEGCKKYGLAKKETLKVEESMQVVTGPEERRWTAKSCKVKEDNCRLKQFGRLSLCSGKLQGV